MSYIVVKTVKGRRYLYEQRTWREGKRVRTESRYLGPADGGGRPGPARRPRREGVLTKVGKLIAANTLSAEERLLVLDEDALLREQRESEAAREKARADFEAMMGVKLGPANPIPQDKPVPSIDLASPALEPATAAAPGTESPAADAAGPETASE
jgi:hypothetical protein